MKTDRETLGPLLHDAARLIRRRFEQQTADLGLSSAQWRLLVHVLRENCVTQARLAEMLEIEPISVSRLVDRMEQAGWVRRVTDPNDRRLRKIVATPAAEAAGVRIQAAAKVVYQEALVGLPPGEQEILINGLIAITQNLSQLMANCPQSGTIASKGMGDAGAC